MSRYRTNFVVAKFNEIIYNIVNKAKETIFMRTKQEIADFISMCAGKYDIPMVCYIRNEEKFNASGYKWEAMELFENDYDFEMNIKKLAGLFGCNEESLLNADKNAVLDIYEKYPYFKLYHQWEEVNPEERHRVDIKKEDMADIKNKIVEKIQQINDACRIKASPFDIDKIEHVTCISNGLTSYEKITELVQEYIKVYERYSELFFKVIKQELNPYEIHEFNIFSAHFVAMDSVCMSKFISYDYVRKISPILKKENYTHLANYIKVRIFKPWSAKEFSNNIEVVERYMKCYPKSKRELRTFIFLLKNKRYAFVYDSGSFEISIEKEPEQICEYQPYIDRLNKLTLSQKVSGIAVEWDEPSEEEETHRMNERLELFEKEGISIYE